MKQFLFILLAAAALFSCKKQYKCACTTTVYDADSTAKKTYDAEVIEIDAKLSSKQAEAACEHEAAALRTTYRNIYGSSTFTTPVQEIRTASSCVLQ